MGTPFVRSSQRLKRLFGLTLVAATITGMVACDDTVDPEAINFAIDPPSATMSVGGSQQLTAKGAPGTVDWSSSASTIAAVVRETGFVTGVARGTATISALSAGVVKTATITVEIDPAISMSAPMVDFARLVGGAPPADQSVQITNGGDGTLSDLSLGTTQYAGGPFTGGQLSNPSWLVATLSSAAAPATVNLSINGASLARGTYTATIPIQSSVASNSPQSLLVTFQVQAPPVITASPNPVQITALPGQSASGTASITNTGDGTLTGMTTSIAYQNGSGWLTAALDGPNAPATLSLGANGSGLTVGTYNATVSIASSTQGVATLDLPVQFVVSPGPAITVSSTSVSFNAAFGTSPSNQSVNITNGGGGTLNGLTAAVTTGAAWLSATLNGTTAPSSVTLSVSSASLAAGTYNGSVNVASSVASNSPRTINVTLTVGPSPVVVLNPGSLTFSTYQGATMQPGSQSVSVTNGGGGTLSGLSTSVTYSGASGWLVPTFSGGTTAPTTISVQANTGSLTEGTYNATLLVTASGATSASISITFVVRSFTTNVFSLFAPAGCNGSSCHNSAAPVLNTDASTAHTNLLAKVTPGNPNVGDLICKITNVSTSTCTSFGGMTMSAGAIATIREWISRGAPLN